MVRPINPSDPPVRHLDPRFCPKLRDVLHAAVTGGESHHPVPEGVIIEPRVEEEAPARPIPGISPPSGGG